MEKMRNSEKSLTVCITQLLIIQIEKNFSFFLSILERLD
jgi:hypothetical protein